MNNRVEKIMRKRAEKQNTAHDYTALHGFTWFVFGLILGVCSLVGAWSDGEVLYSILYNSTSQPLYSLIKAVLGAVLIQVLIWGGCTPFFKMVMYGKYKNDKGGWDWLNLPHMIIYFLLGLAGFLATLYLSNQTHSPLLLRTKHQHQQHQHQHQQQVATLDSLGDDALEELRMEYINDSTMIENRYHALIYADTITHSHKIGSYIGRFRRGEISEAKKNTKVNIYNGKIKEALKPHLRNKAHEQQNLRLRYKNQRDSIRANNGVLIADAHSEGEDTGNKILDNTRLAGSVLIGKNLAFNSVSIILILGLQFFYKGVNETNPTPKEEEPKRKLNIQLTPSPSLGMMDGATQHPPTPSNIEDEVLEVIEDENPTPTTTHPSDPPENLWGTIEGNKDSEFRAEGSLGKRRVIMKYFGKNGATFVSKSYIRGQYKNRISKAATTVDPKAKERNQNWANFWYDKLIEIGEYERGLFDNK